PFPQVSRLMRDLRRVIPVSLEGNDRGRAIDLLRGMTIEFHRPLRHALAAFLPGDDPARSSADPKAHAFALGVLRKVSSRMTIRPKEFAANEIEALVMKDPDTWLAAFFQFADRARLLPLAAQALADVNINLPGAKRLRAVADNF